MGIGGGAPRGETGTDLAALARETAEGYGMFPEGALVLAMVSGGADSTALLRLLAEGVVGPGADRLSVLTVDHMLRGEDSAADAAFVARTCAALGLECRVVRYDVGAYAAEERLNLEDAGRRVRYRFAEEELDEACRRSCTPPALGRVAVAHTRDDQVETFLMRLVTGSGAGGLSAIPPVRGRIVRPLIGARREHVVAFLEGLGQPWREDATNADTTRLRARIRHELVPALTAVNPAFPDVVARTVRVVADEDVLLSGMAAAFVSDFAEIREGEVVFDRDLMATLSLAMSRRTVREALRSTFPEASRLEQEHVEALVRAMPGRDPFARDLPEGLRARGEYGRMVVLRQGRDAGPLAPALLDIPGECDLGGAGRIEAVWTGEGVSEDRYAVTIDADRVGGPLTVDGPREGDRFRPLGMTGTKKLSDLFTDEKVPRRERKRVPVVRDGGEIVWVAGVRLSEEYKVTPETGRRALLRWVRER